MPEKIYLPGLNGVRFIAALAVLIHHVEQGKGSLGLANGLASPPIHRAGGLGVTVFFVLSGYLITYLLLTELRTTSTIRIRDFYVRRILRIWPLYYLIVVLGWVVAPTLVLFSLPLFESPFGPGFLPGIAFYLLLCPQFLPARQSPTLAGPLWSVGVEEHFYAFWPLLVRAFRGRIVLPFAGIVGALVAARFYLRHPLRLPATPEEWTTHEYMVTLLDQSRFGCMAIGGLAAWLWLSRPESVRWLFRRDVQAVILAALAACLAFGVVVPAVDAEFYSVLFAILILNISLNGRSLLKLENRVFLFMGEISFGLYVYHWFIIAAVLNLLKGWSGLGRPVLGNVVLYGVVVGLTTAVAAASHYLIERPFLRMKARFSAVLSGQAAKPGADPSRA